MLKKKLINVIIFPIVIFVIFYCYTFYNIIYVLPIVFIIGTYRIIKNDLKQILIMWFFLKWPYKILIYFLFYLLLTIVSVSISSSMALAESTENNCNNIESSTTESDIYNNCNYIRCYLYNYIYFGLYIRASYLWIRMAFKQYWIKSVALYVFSRTRGFFFLCSF